MCVPGPITEQINPMPPHLDQLPMVAFVTSLLTYPMLRNVSASILQLILKNSHGRGNGTGNSDIAEKKNTDVEPGRNAGDTEGDFKADNWYKVEISNILTTSITKSDQIKDQHHKEEDLGR